MGDVISILKQLKGAAQTMDALAFLTALAVSFLFSVLIVVIYRFFFAQRHTGSGVDRAFLLIGPSVTALFIAIQFSLPLSLGLLGALSFVRFRTPIKQPEEVGYILLLIATSIGCATFNYLLIGILLFIILVALGLKQSIFGFLDKNYQNGLILISLKEENYQTNSQAIESFIKSNFRGAKLESLSVTEGIVSLFYRFKKEDEKDLGLLAGKLKGTAKAEKVNIFLEDQRQI